MYFLKNTFCPVILLSLFLNQNYADTRDNDIIIDYFIFKQVSSVIGYSCNTIEGKQELRIF